jgi:Ku protein
MPRASWNGFLRLSLVTCPVYLAPATTESKRIRFNQLNAETGNRLKQQLIDAETGEVVERDRIAKGYEYSRGQYVTVDDDELKALQIESSKIVDLTQFVSRDEVDPVYVSAIATMSASASPFAFAENSAARTSSVPPRRRASGRGVPGDRRGDGKRVGGDWACHDRQPRAPCVG